MGGLRVRLRAAKRILALEMELANTRKNLHHTASHDSMTVLLNHKGIIDVLRQKFDLLGISDQPEPVSIVMMDRGMIPLGSLIMSFFADQFGVLNTFLIMGISTVAISVIFYLMQRITKIGGIS